MQNPRYARRAHPCLRGKPNVRLSLGIKDCVHPNCVEKYFTHSEDKVREEAIRAAGELELSHTRETLIDILENDESDDILAATIWSLSQIGGEGVRGAITKLALNIQDEELLEFIEEALENLDFTEELSRFDLFELDSDGSED